ncbi:hypothetical protein [Nocardia sp. IFM 10818]
MSGYALHAGARVELPPWLDAWMQGDRYGTIASATARAVRIRLDMSGRIIRLCHPSTLDALRVLD